MVSSQLYRNIGSVVKIGRTVFPAWKCDIIIQIYEVVNLNLHGNDEITYLRPYQWFPSLRPKKKITPR